MKKKFLLSLNEINVLSEYLEKILNKKNYIVILRGDLASGKTTLVKEIANNFKIKELVTSPTFSIQSIYSDNFFHYDLYNIKLQEFVSMGLLEEFDKPGLHFVEWGDKKMENILKEYGYDFMVITIEKKDNKRLYEIEA